MLLLIAGVFVVTFITVCAVAYVLLAKRRTGGPATPWKVRAAKPFAGLVEDIRADRGRDSGHHGKAAGQWSHTGAAQPTRPGSRSVRVRLPSLFVSLELAGLTGGILLLRSHTPGNMNGLPGAIIVLLSLGALLKGIVPGPSVMAVEPLDQVHLDQLK